MATLLAAGEALFVERGIEAVTIDEIAGAAGTAKGNFYRYFDDKRALVDAIIAPIVAVSAEALAACATAISAADDAESTAQAYRQLASALATGVLAHPRAVRLYLQERRAPVTPARQGIQALSKQLEDAAFTLTKQATDRGLLVVADPRVSALAVIGAVESLSLAALDGSLSANPAEVAAVLIGLVLDGIRQKP